MKANISGLKSIVVVMAVSICLSLLAGEKCHSYVMPSEQLIGFMINNFKSNQTLVVTQSTLWRDQDRERVFKEQIRMKSPGIYNLKPLDTMEDEIEEYDLSYRQLLLANSRERMKQLLEAMGIDLQAVAFTRIDGVISYRIGDKAPDSPKLLIEKARFLPLIIVYRLPGNGSGEMVSVRFRDYRKEEEGWYPFEIEYSLGSRILLRHTILNFQANSTVDTSLLEPFEIGPGPVDKPMERGSSDIEEERLRKIIEAFEEKYQ